ncbi:MAG TPA: hypothetical protein VF188_11730 [Longimicrobiales bacterium]
MKLREIFRFELLYQLRRVPTWLYFTAMVLVPLAHVRGTYIDEARIGGFFLNAPWVIAQVTVVATLIWLLVAPAVAGTAAARDVRTRMDPLTYTAPIRKVDYLGGRFLAAFVLNALILLAVPAGILLAMTTAGIEPEFLGPFRPAAYLGAYAFIVLPNAFIGTAIQFSLAALSRRSMASHFGGVLLFFAAVALAPMVVDGLGLRELKSLLDPVAIGAIDDFTAAHPLAERNTLLIGLEGALLWNRLLWVGIALVGLAVAHARFRFTHLAGTGWWRRITRRRDAHDPARVTTGPAPAASTAGGGTAALGTIVGPISPPKVVPAFGLATHARQTAAIAWASFRTIVARPGALVFIGLLVLFVAGLGPAAMGNTTPMSIPVVPRTEYVIDMFLASSLTNVQERFEAPPLNLLFLVIPLLVVIYAGELVWRDRDAELSEVVDAAPVPDWASFMGRFLGLGLVLVAWLAVLMAAAVVAQARMGYTDFELGLYARILFGLRLPEYLLLAMVALVVHVIVDQRHVGHLVSLVALFCIIAAPVFGIEHDLFIYGAAPAWSYTEMSGFGASLAPWSWFTLYWAAWALLLAVVARLLWVRGRERGLGMRLRTARRRFTGATAGTAAAAVALIMALGGFIFYNTNVLNDFHSTRDLAERRAEYERRYGRYEDVAQPRVAGARLHVEIYPDRRAFEIRGTYVLVNRAGAPIDSIHVATPLGAVTGPLEFDRPGRAVVVDERLGHRIYALDSPLEPGDSLRLGFDVAFEARGFREAGGGGPVAANGTYFTSQEWLPAIGYQPGRELSSASDRRDLGLDPRPPIPPLDDVRARMTPADRIAFDAVVGTAMDQVAVAPGALRGTWTEAGRRYFHYSSDAPIGSQYAFFSADYAVHEGRWNDVVIRIFHHPAHTANLDRMLRGARAALEYNSQRFGPYPYGQLNLVEHPGHGMGMHAEATTIDYQEGFNLLDPGADPGGLDMPFAVVAHEVSHQWWGSQIAYAPVEGAGLLSESLAWYAAMGAVEETLGRDHLRVLRGRMSNLGEAGFIARKRGTPPLLRARGWFMNYRKGPFAMYALSEYIGEERVNGALRRLIEAHRSGEPPRPTTLDLYRELQAVTPDSLRTLLHDLFEVNAWWELETERATATPIDAGAWRVTLDVRARKVVVDTTGVATEMPMDDPIEIGVYAPGGEGAATGAPLYLGTHRIRSGTQTITVTVPREPARAGIDPRHLLIELETGDNGRSVEIESPPSIRGANGSRP